MSTATKRAEPEGRLPAHAAGLAVSQTFRDDHSTAANGNQLGSIQGSSDPHGRTVTAKNLSRRQPPVDTDSSYAPDPLVPDQTGSDDHCRGVGDDLSSSHSRSDTHSGFAGDASAYLALAAANLDDLERTRIALENRLRAMRDDHGLGGSPQYATAEAIHEALVATERQAGLEMKRALRRHPLHPWVKATIGVGEKQAARLLAAIEDPLWNARDERPRRGPAELWQYCGHGDPERSRRRKGQRVEYSPEAKMRAHLVAVACMKQRKSPYRKVYDDARAAWAERDTTDMHKHNHALRLMAKAMLKDLYLFAKELQTA